MKLMLFIGLLAATEALNYTLAVHTHPEAKNARTKGKFYLSAINYQGDLVDFGLFSNDPREAGDITTFDLSSDMDLGRIGCFTIRTKSKDKWLFGKACISSETDVGFCHINSEDIFISRDTSVDGDNGVLAMQMCAPPLTKAEVKEIGL
ncbi:hypothetical protein ACHWQZ_G004193 [Mnemiopsis leidyi]